MTSALVRRLHDTGKSAAWLCLGLLWLCSTLALPLLFTFLPRLAPAFDLHNLSPGSPGFAPLLALPLFFLLALLLLACAQGQKGPNAFGPDPLDQPAARKARATLVL